MRMVWILATVVMPVALQAGQTTVYYSLPAAQNAASTLGRPLLLHFYRPS